MEKTKVENYLDDLGVRYQPIDSRKEDLENFEAVLQAQKIDPKLVCKTLVLKGDKTGVIIAIVPLAAHLDYKKTRKVSKDHKVGFPGMDYVMAYTGYPHGANTPIGIHKEHPDYLFLADNTLKEQNELVMSSGEIGRSIKIARKDFETIVKPIYADLV